MKLSEAILLGSTVVTPKAGALHFSGENAGCALGMAAIASGCTFSPAQPQIAVKGQRPVNVEDIWGPWLLRVVDRPCDCRGPITLGPLPRGMRIKDIIAHLFDQHVMGRRDWTLDQLVGWLEHWEPSELAQNTFIGDVSRESRLPPRWHELSDAAAEWQKTCGAFQARVDAKRRRGPSAR